MAAEARWRADQGAARQAGALLNPILELRREDFGSDSPRQEVAPQESLTLNQPFRTAGKRAAQRDAAQWASDASRQDVERLRLDVLAEVDRRFAGLLGAQERAAIAEENLATASEVAAAVGALVEAGEVSPVELSRAENERDLAAIDLEEARRDEDVARRELAAVLGQREPLFERAEGALAQEVQVPPEGGASEAVRALPDLARWDAETKSLEASLRLAKKAPWPDLTLAFGVRRYTATGERAYVAGIVLPLPLFDRNRGGVIEASARLDQGRIERRAEEVRLENAFASARLVLAQAGAEVRTMKERVLPNAQRVFEALDEGYRRGRFSLLDLLEARRSLADARLRFVDALTRLNVAKADMDRLAARHAAQPQGVNP
jgi:cobalt-zinc-cadmium efflux system outer membrane protein